MIVHFIKKKSTKIQNKRGKKRLKKKIKTNEKRKKMDEHQK